jgi:hypothetical protein
MYLGCNGAACSFSDSIIERNYVHDLGGSQGDGIEIKQGSWGNVVRDNVIVRAIYPGITLYSFEAMAGRMPNVIERNLVWGSMDNGIQVTGRAIIRNNIVGGAAASGIASQPNMDTPTEVQILFNTVVGAGDSCVRASSWDTGTGFVIANNALYCEGARAIRIASASSATVVGNVGLGAVEGVTGGFTMGTSLAADLGTMTTMARVYPPAGSALLDAADASQSVSDDFDLRARSGALDVGAYERDASGMPAWLAVEGFKEIGAVMPGTDAGTGLDAGVVIGEDAAIPPGVDAGPLPDAFVPPGVDAGRVPGVPTQAPARAAAAVAAASSGAASPTERSRSPRSRCSRSPCCVANAERRSRRAKVVAEERMSEEPQRQRRRRALHARGDPRAGGRGALRRALARHAHARGSRALRARLCDGMAAAADQRGRDSTPRPTRSAETPTSSRTR